jgi:hypothetical protein
MANTWKPKRWAQCQSCGWTGRRAVIYRACPKCGKWHPKDMGPASLPRPHELQLEWQKEPNHD